MLCDIINLACLAILSASNIRENVDVGGIAKIGGGEVSRDVDVGGKFESVKPFKFSKLDVGGLASLNQGGEGGDVDVQRAEGGDDLLR